MIRIIIIHKQTCILVSATKSEPRYDALIRYAETMGSEIIIINEDCFSHQNIPRVLMASSTTAWIRVIQDL
jgi:tRNA-dihydrouridine synthase